MTERFKALVTATALATAACGIVWGEYYLWWNTQLSSSVLAIFGFVIATIIAMYMTLMSFSIFSVSGNETWLRDSSEAAGNITTEFAEGCGTLVSRLIGIGIAVLIVVFSVSAGWSFLIQYMTGGTVLIAALLVITIIMLALILSALGDVRKAILSTSMPRT
jgi:hypothetical protein